jgi:hypothetical protein
MKTIIIQKGDSEHQDSFWYRDTVAIVENKNKKVCVIANGDIRINKDNGETICDISKERNGGFGFKVENDNDLAKVNEENGFFWEMNNWFEVFENDLGDMGKVCDTYDEALKVAQELAITK